MLAFFFSIVSLRMMLNFGQIRIVSFVVFWTKCNRYHEHLRPRLKFHVVPADLGFEIQQFVWCSQNREPTCWPHVQL